MAVIDDVKIVLRETLQLGPRADALTAETRLLGGIPEFDSMAVVTLVGELEEHFDIVVEDEDITAEVFETVGTLVALIEQKVEA